jgi:hypothetical protein
MLNLLLLLGNLLAQLWELIIQDGFAVLLGLMCEMKPCLRHNQKRALAVGKGLYDA